MTELMQINIEFIEALERRLSNLDEVMPPTKDRLAPFPHARQFLKYVIQRHPTSYDLVPELAAEYAAESLAEKLDHALQLLQFDIDKVPEWLNWHQKKRGLLKGHGTK